MIRRISARRAAAGMAVATVLAVAGSGLAAGTASAQTVDTGSLSFTGAAGDYISGGQSYAYSTAAQDGLTVSGSEDDSVVSVSVQGANGDWWNLDLGAPAGQPLAAGTYADATRYPFNAPASPGLSLDGNGRGCNELTGDFTVSDVVFGPHGYVQELDATYDQSCDGGAPLHGEVHVSNPEPPAELDLGLDVAVDGTASALDGDATVHGTVSCDKPAKVTVSGSVVQVKHKQLNRAPYTTSVNCTPDAPAAWTATAVPTGTIPFLRGEAEVQAQATAPDTDYGTTVTAAQTAVVTFAKR